MTSFLVLTGGDKTGTRTETGQTDRLADCQLQVTQTQSDSD